MKRPNNDRVSSTDKSIPDYGNLGGKEGDAEGGGDGGAGILSENGMPIFAQMNTPLPQSEDYPEHNAVTRLRNSEGASDGAKLVRQKASREQSEYQSLNQRN